MIDFKTFLNEHYTFKKVKLSTLNEASLTKRDIMNPKHNYLLDFIEIAKNEPIMFGDNLSDAKNNAFKLNDEDIKKLEYLHSIRNNDTEVSKFLKDKSNWLSCNRPIVGSGGIFKGRLTQLTKTAGKKANIDDERESAVGVIFDFLIQNPSIPEDEILMTIPEWHPNGLFKPEITSDDNAAIVEFLSNKKNFKDSLNCAKSIVEIYKNSGMGNYAVHHKSQSFDYIKKSAVDIIKNYGITCKEDKWNPSDIFILRKGYSVKKYKDILEYNTQFLDYKNILGISLKASTEGALHGSAGLTNLEKLLNANGIPLSSGTTTSETDDTETFYNSYIEDIKQLKNVICYIPKNVKDINSSLESFEPDKGWKKCYSVLIDFILKYRADLNKMATYLYNWAHSSLEISAPYFKVEGDKFSEINPSSQENAELVNIHIPLSAEKFIWLELNVNGKTVWVKGRQKETGSKPQWMLDNAGMAKNKYKVVDINTYKHF